LPEIVRNGLADLLEPSGIEAPPQEEARPDFAFADTVATLDLDELPPPSVPNIVSDPFGQTHQLTPIAYALPNDVPEVGLGSIRGSFKKSVAEMRELWSATLDLVDPLDRVLVEDKSHRRRAVIVLRRMLALWQFWQWDRTDMLRAAIIGMAVFLVIAVSWLSASHFVR